MSVKQQIDDDLKAALLSGDKTLATTLRGVKSAILNAEIASHKRDSGLSEDELIQVLSKEAKKRQESADLYARGGNTDRQQAELAEKRFIEKYLPEQISEKELAKMVDEVISQVGKDVAKMGQIIGQVKQTAGVTADAAVIARLVKDKLQ